MPSQTANRRLPRAQVALVAPPVPPHLHRRQALQTPIPNLTRPIATGHLRRRARVSIRKKRQQRLCLKRGRRAQHRETTQCHLVSQPSHPRQTINDADRISYFLLISPHSLSNKCSLLQYVMWVLNTIKANFILLKLFAQNRDSFISCDVCICI